MKRCKKQNNPNSCPADGVLRTGDSAHIKDLLKVFQDKMKIVESQKERFSPYLFGILEKTHFENLLPFNANIVAMPRQEATDIFIAYAEELHRLHQSNIQLCDNIRNVEQLIHRDQEYVVEYIMKEFEKCTHNINKRISHIDRIITNHLQSLIQLETRCDELQNILCVVNQEIKDTQIDTTKRMNYLETELNNKDKYSNIKYFAILLVVVAVQYILSKNIFSQPESTFPMLPSI